MSKFKCWREDVEEPVFQIVEANRAEDAAIRFIEQNWWEMDDPKPEVVEVAVKDPDGKRTAWTVDIEIDPTISAFENDVDEEHIKRFKEPF